MNFFSIYLVVTVCAITMVFAIDVDPRPRRLKAKELFMLGQGVTFGVSTSCLVNDGAAFTRGNQLDIVYNMRDSLGKELYSKTFALPFDMKGDNSDTLFYCFHISNAKKEFLYLAGFKSIMYIIDLTETNKKNNDLLVYTTQSLVADIASGHMGGASVSQLPSATNVYLTGELAVILYLQQENGTLVKTTTVAMDSTVYGVYSTDDVRDGSDAKSSVFPNKRIFVCMTDDVDSWMVEIEHLANNVLKKIGTTLKLQIGMHTASPTAAPFAQQMVGVMNLNTNQPAISLFAQGTLFLIDVTDKNAFKIVGEQTVNAVMKEQMCFSGNFGASFATPQNGDKSTGEWRIFDTSTPAYTGAVWYVDHISIKNSAHSCIVDTRNNLIYLANTYYNDMSQKSFDAAAILYLSDFQSQNSLQKAFPYMAAFAVFFAIASFILFSVIVMRKFCGQNLINNQADIPLENDLATAML